jgi:hypothetical protein
MFHGLDHAEQPAAPDGSWFVYLLYACDCSAFKVGFTCNPLRRLYSFNRRYFERFDLDQSYLLQLEDRDQASDVESHLKRELAEYRTDCPAWVAAAAGGHTEWFAATCNPIAVAHIGSYSSSRPATRLLAAADYVRTELGRLSSSFELWAWQQAQQVCEPSSHPAERRLQIEIAKALCDWMDAYRVLNVDLFHEDRAVARFVAQCAVA